MTRLVSLLVAFVFLNAAWAAENLPSWNDAAARRGIIEFVKAVSDKKSKDYVPLAERIAVFGRRLVAIVRHDGAEREFAYDRPSHVGQLDKAWDEAKAKNWIVVSMKSDWKKIFAFEK